MSFIGIMLLASAVLPSDQLKMADHLFNEGKYREAKAEYLPLRQENTIRLDEILFRLAETSRLLGEKDEANRLFAELLENCPNSKYANRSRLLRATSLENKEEKLKELRLLDGEKVDAPTRAAALYHLGSIEKNPALLHRSMQIDPNGRYAAYAAFQRATILTQSEKESDVREATSTLLDIAFKKSPFSEEALYMAAVQIYRQKNYDHSAALFSRYLKNHPQGKHASSALVALAWSDYLTGKYLDTIKLCEARSEDDLKYLLGAALLATGETEKANEAFVKYLEEYPLGRNRLNAELAIARENFRVAEKSADMQLAIESAKKAYEISKMSGDKLRLAWAYEKNAQVDEALKLYVEIQRESPNSSDQLEALYRSAMLDLRAGRWSKAELELREALKSSFIGNRKASTQYWLGFALLRQDHFDEGSKFLNEAMASGLNTDENREATLMVADIAYESGKSDEAKAKYLEIVKAGGCERMSAAKTLAIGKFLGGEGAKICAEALIQNEASEWKQAGYALLGRAEEDLESFRAAIDAYRKAMEIDIVIEDIASASLNLGKLEMKMGENAAAEETLIKSVKYNSKSPRERAEAYMLLAENYQAMNNIEKARGYATVVTTLFDLPEFNERVQKILGQENE